MTVQFFFLSKQIPLQNRKKLKSFLKSLFTYEKKELESIVYIFCSDEYLLKINEDFLKHSYYTDIITFDMSETNRIKGEVYISVERVQENAIKMGVSVNNELHRVIFHGVLHLCGYKDKSKVDKQRMRQKEDFYIEQFFK